MLSIYMQTCFYCLKLDHFHSFYTDLIQIKRFLLQNYRIRFQLCHIQYIVYQRKQMFRTGINFSNTFIYLFLIRTFICDHGKHTHDSVDRCADIMWHICQKFGFHLIGARFIFHWLLQFSVHFKIPFKFQRTLCLQCGDHLCIKRILPLKRCQHSTFVANAFCIGILIFFHFQTDFKFIRMQIHICLHTCKNSIHQRGVFIFHCTIKNCFAGIDKLRHIHFIHFIKHFFLKCLILFPVFLFKCQKHSTDQQIMLDILVAVIFFHTFIICLSWFTQSGQIVVNWCHIQVNICTHFLIRISQILVCHQNITKCFYIILLCNICQGNIVVLIGITALFFMIFCYFQSPFEKIPRQDILTFTVCDHPHQIETGNQLRHIFVTLIIYNQGLQNFLRRQIISRMVIEQRFIKTCHHCHFCFSRLLVHYICIKIQLFPLWQCTDPFCLCQKCFVIHTVFLPLSILYHSHIVK